MTRLCNTKGGEPSASKLKRGSTDECLPDDETCNEEFVSSLKHDEFLTSQGELPKGFKVGTSSLTFDPVEEPGRLDLPMRLTLILLDEPTDNWAAMFTSNAFPGAPIKVGRERVASGGELQAVLVNNKISNVCSGGAPGSGVRASEDLCAGLGGLLALHLRGDASPEAAAAAARAVLPCSTGIIGWGLPVAPMLRALPAALEEALRGDLNAKDAAASIMTTDRYPKVRGETVRGNPGGKPFRVVGMAKGAGMVEPHLATMLVYVLTDLDVPRATLDQMLRRAVKASFNCISVDSDESTSDTVVAVSSNAVKASTEPGALAAFEKALTKICRGLADDVVRNGEGTNHVMRVAVTGAPDDAYALGLGRAVVNSPLLKCAVAGNDPNVGRLVAAVGKYVGDHPPFPNTRGLASGGESGGDGSIEGGAGGPVDVLAGCSMRMGGRTIFRAGQFILSGETEQELVQHMRSAELGDQGRAVFPAHKRVVEVEVDLALAPPLAAGAATVLGSDLTHEYVSVNADYRS